MAYSTIPKGSLYMNTKLYTGNGSTNAQTGVGFQPDFTWIKARSNAENHNLFDAVRGATKRIRSNGTEAEDTRTTSLTAFGSDGFTLGSGSQVNTNGWTFAAWNWLANGAGSANTDGSISSTVSANTTSGFSIVKFTGTGANATIGHGLGVAPKIIIQKGLDAVLNWKMYHSSLGAGAYMNFDDTAGSASSTVTWNNTAPTSSLFSVGSGNNNNSSQAYIAYCFAEKQGYSKFGSYTGNGATLGPFVYTGFSPSFVLYKDSTSVSDWVMKDNRRPGFNVTDDVLYPNLADAEGSGADIDFLSNGFKARTTAANTNKSNAGFIYMAFAENPFVATSGTNAIPVTAR